MILQTDAIRRFLAESSVVKPNVLYPNLSDLIKIEYSANIITFTKTNNNIFCTWSFQDTGFHIDDELYLVSEKSLNALVQTTQSVTVDIEQKDGMVHVSATQAESVSYPITPATDFPNTPPCTGEAVPIDSEALYCIKVAGNYLSDAQMVTAANYVNVTEVGVLGTNNNNIAYRRKFDGLPTMFLNDDALNVVKPVAGVTYSTQGNYNFFHYDGLSYGTIKPVIEKPINTGLIFNQPRQQAFEIERKKLLDFCTLVRYTAKTQFPIGSLTYDTKKITLTHDDPDFNVHVKRDFECLNNFAPVEKFSFSVPWLETLLKPLPYETLVFNTCGPHFIITSNEDEHFTALFAALVTTENK